MSPRNPLSGLRVVITRPQPQADAFESALQATGAIPILFPTIQIAPIHPNPELDAALGQLSTYDWIVFTSVNGVRVVLARMAELHIPSTALAPGGVAAIGPATAEALHKNGIDVRLQPDEYIAEAIVAGLIAQGNVANRRFLLLRADIARRTLRDQLVAAGAFVAEIPVYRTVRGAPSAEAYAQLRGGVDILTFTSSSTVRFFFDLLGDEAHSIASAAAVACIGPVTAQTAREMGLTVSCIAGEYTVPGLLAALQEPR